MFGRNKVATMVAEFLGTGILTLVVLSVQRSNIGIPYFVAIAAGLTVALMLLVVGKTSGAQLNPALTLGLWTARKIETATAVVYIAMQLLGAWGAYGLYRYFVNTPVQATGGHFEWRILIAEAVGGFILAVGWAAAAYNKYNEGLQSATVGVSYILAIIVASTATAAVGIIGFVNPALALGVRSWVWSTYVLGPIVGAVIGINFHNLLVMSPKGSTAKGSGKKK